MKERFPSLILILLIIFSDYSDNHSVFQFQQHLLSAAFPICRMITYYLKKFNLFKGQLL